MFYVSYLLLTCVKVVFDSEAIPQGHIHSLVCGSRTSDIFVACLQELKDFVQKWF